MAAKEKQYQDQQDKIQDHLTRGGKIEQLLHKAQRRWNFEMSGTDAKEVRKFIGYSQQKMAERLGVTRQTIANNERQNAMVDCRTTLAILTIAVV